MENFETHDDQRVYLGDGTYLHLFKRNISKPEFGSTSEDYSRNVYRMAASGDIIWRITAKADYRGCPFTELFRDNNPRLLFNSSGFRCLIDLETGVAETYDYPLLGSWKKSPFPLGNASKRFFERNGTEERVYLDDGTYLFLAQRNIADDLTDLSPEDYARNVFRMTEDGDVLWKIKTDRDSDGSPFTFLYEDEDPRKMVNWDGFKYLVNLETGEAETYAYSR